MAAVTALQPQEDNHGVSHRVEAVEVLFTMLVKTLAGSHPEAMENFVSGMKKAAKVPDRVRYRGAPLNPMTWEHIGEVIEDLDGYLSSHRSP